MYARQIVKEQHDSHVTKQRLAEIMARLNSGVAFGSADDYYWYKNRARQLAASLNNMSERQYDPVGVWHGMQSN